MSKHTPGPWTANGRFVTSGKGEIADAHRFFDVQTNADAYAEAQANAALIAAAPDMAEALRTVAAMSARSFEGKQMIALARAALAKAGF